MKRKPWMWALLATVAIAGCRREAPAEAVASPESARTDAVAEAPAPVAMETADLATSSADAPFDVMPFDVMPFDIKGFAGTFSGVLPCTGCTGIDCRLVLNADGTFHLDETRRGDGDGAGSGDSSLEGTWTVEADDTRLRLDPNSKSQDDRLFEILSNDGIRALTPDGSPIEGGSGLKRDA